MFRLLIECTKDIDTLQINFSDGTSVITEKTENSCNDKIKIDENYENTNEEALEAIKVPDVSDRPVKIDENLNGMDF